MKKLLNTNSGSKPLYKQVYEILVKKLEKGEYTIDDTLPTESEFQSIFGVSRITARKALEQLKKDGYVKRKRGIGTIVVRNSKEPKLKVKSFFNNIGKTRLKRKLISVEEILPEEKIANYFLISLKEKITKIQRVIMTDTDDVPLALNTIFISPKVNIDFKKINLEKSLYMILEDEGHNIDNYNESLKASLPNKDEANILNIDMDEPLFVRVRKGYTHAGKAIEYSINKHISRYYEYNISLE